MISFDDEEDSYDEYYDDESSDEELDGGYGDSSHEPKEDIEGNDVHVNGGDTVEEVDMMQKMRK